MNEKFEYRQAKQAIDWVRLTDADRSITDALELVLEYARAVAERLRDVMEHNELSRGL